MLGFISEATASSLLLCICFFTEGLRVLFGFRFFSKLQFLWFHTILNSHSISPRGTPLLIFCSLFYQNLNISKSLFDAFFFPVRDLLFRKILLIPLEPHYLSTRTPAMNCTTFLFQPYLKFVSRKTRMTFSSAWSCSPFLVLIFKNWLFTHCSLCPECPFSLFFFWPSLYHPLRRSTQ